MIQYLNIHNFRCFQNFEFRPGDYNSLLLIGKNGSGKSTLAKALSIFQRLGQGVSSTSSLVDENDFTAGHTNERMAFKIEALLDGKTFAYDLVLDKPAGFREMRVVEEFFSADGNPVFTRQEAQVTLYRPDKQSEFSMDWHSVALPVIIGRPESPLEILCAWFRNMLILRPVPQLMGGETVIGKDSHLLAMDCENFAAYLTELLTSYPSSYLTISNFIQELISDLRKFDNVAVGTIARQLKLFFGNSGTSVDIDFSQISDGEKCMFLCAAVLAAQEVNPKLFVFWDEPDNYLALPEVEHFVGILSQRFCNGSQIWMTSHNAVTMNCFSHENTFLLRHKNHRDPSELRQIDEILSSKESVSRKMLLNELD